MVRGLMSFAVVAVTVVFQLTVVDRIAFPGGAGPDLVLLAVAALGLASGPLAGVLTGFWAGLALDVAPPGSHFTGEDALVFCLIGYACGLLADDSSGDAVTEQGHTALFEIMVTAAGAICGEALVALLGVMLSDPRITWPAITNVLPVAVAYDVMLCPFVLYAAAAALRLAGARSKGRRVGWSPGPARTAVPGAVSGAVRQVAGGNMPRLRLSDKGLGRGSIGALRGAGAGARPVANREPKLKLGRTLKAARKASMTGGLGASFATGGLGGGPARVRFGSSKMGRSLLGGSLFSRSSSPLGGLTGAIRTPARQKSPGRGWLRGMSPPRNSLGASSLRRGFLGRRTVGRSAFKGSAFKGSAFKGSAFKGSAFKGSAFKGSAFGRGGIGRGSRLHMPRAKAKRRWRTGGYR